MNPQKAEFLLSDLARWKFGELLASRTDFTALDFDALSAEVRAYRYGILCAILKDEILRERSLAEAWVAAPWDLMQEWMQFAQEISWGPEAEIDLAKYFVSRLEAKGSVGDAMRRFARGKAFKYGRRVLLLNDQFHAS